MFSSCSHDCHSISPDKLKIECKYCFFQQCFDHFWYVSYFQFGKTYLKICFCEQVSWVAQLKVFCFHFLSFASNSYNLSSRKMIQVTWKWSEYDNVHNFTCNLVTMNTENCQHFVFLVSLQMTNIICRRLSYLTFSNRTLGYSYHSHCPQHLLTFPV